MISRTGLYASRTLCGFFLCLLLLSFASAIHADGIQTCDEAGLDTALAAGGVQTFDCAAAATIVITTPKVIDAVDVTLDGGGC